MEQTVPLLCRVFVHSWEYSRLNVSYSFTDRDRYYRLRECSRCGLKEIHQGGLGGWMGVDKLTPEKHPRTLEDLRKAGFLTDLLRPAGAPEDEELLRPR